MKTMRERLIERVGRALDLADTVSSVDEADIVDGLMDEMREPDEEMIHAAVATPGMQAASGAMTLHQARGYRFDPAGFADGSSLHQAWRAMIDCVRLQK